MTICESILEDEFAHRNKEESYPLLKNSRHHACRETKRNDVCKQLVCRAFLYARRRTPLCAVRVIQSSTQFVLFLLDERFGPLNKCCIVFGYF